MSNFIYIRTYVPFYPSLFSMIFTFISTLFNLPLVSIDNETKSLSKKAFKNQIKTDFCRYLLIRTQFDSLLI